MVHYKPNYFVLVLKIPKLGNVSCFLSKASVVCSNLSWYYQTVGFQCYFKGLNPRDPVELINWLLIC